MVEYHGKKWKEYADEKKLKPVPFRQWRLKTIFCDYIFPGSPVTKSMARIDFFLELLPRNELNLIVTLTNVELRKNNC